MRNFEEFKIINILMLCFVFAYRFLASGDQQKSIAKDYRLGRSTVCKIIHETTQAIYTALKPTYLKFPEQEDWIRIAHGYENRWNFPHCVGAVDGKHFAIPRPPNSSSEYFNYKVIKSCK